jgi:hypothetical protein
MRVCAIVYKEQPPEEIDEDANEGDGLKEEERGRERPLRHVTSRHFAPPPPPPPPRAQHAVANITQYVTTGPILLDPSTMPAGQQRRCLLWTIAQGKMRIAACRVPFSTLTCLFALCVRVFGFRAQRFHHRQIVSSSSITHLPSLPRPPRDVPRN